MRQNHQASSIEGSPSQTSTRTSRTQVGKLARGTPPKQESRAPPGVPTQKHFLAINQQTYTLSFHSNNLRDPQHQHINTAVKEALRELTQNRCRNRFDVQLSTTNNRRLTIATQHGSDGR